ncbi:phosphatidylglycerophosphatase A [candidate division KSB1 bacterium]|nr:phosphatidylglycerophosphatase A [candidate division KSB1 bacterium]
MFSKWIATLFGVGYFPVAPGTAGSLVAAVMLWLFPFASVRTFFLVLLLLFFIGVFSATEFEKWSCTDDRRIVIDEFTGMGIALFLIPPKVWLFGAGFLLFRVLDIVKPFPLKRLERLPRGWGVMLDDVGAGIYTNLILWLILLILG